MHNLARNRAYDAAHKDPFAFLLEHYRLMPTSCHEVVKSRFSKFGAATGVGMQSVMQAVAAFRARESVAPFVLQAASAEQAHKYASAQK